MDIRHLRSFVVLAEELHFGRAADRLGLSQPPLSQQIQALEADLGAALFARTSRRVDLTDVGRIFLVEARAAIDRFDRAVAAGRRAAKGELGEIRISFTSSAPLSDAMPGLIRAFRHARPDVHLTLQEMLSQHQLAALREGTMDVAFLRGPGNFVAGDTSIETIELGREEVLLFMAKGHPLAQTPPDRRIAMGELVGEPFVHFARESGATTYAQLYDLCRAAGFEPVIAQEAREAATLVSLVAAGLGLTLLATSFRAIDLPNVVTRRLAEPAPTLSTWIAHRRGDTAPAVRAFVETARRLA